MVYAFNVSIPVGQFDAHGYSVGIRADGQFRNVKDLASTVVSMTQDGRQVLLLDGDNLRDGLAADLGFAREDRAENLRRTAQVARLLAEGGTIVHARRHVFSGSFRRASLSFSTFR